MEREGQEFFGGTKRSIWGLIGWIGHGRGRSEKRFLVGFTNGMGNTRGVGLVKECLAPL